MSADVVTRSANYGLELVDGLTDGPLLGRSTVVETTTHLTPYRVNASRWVWEGLRARVPATFVITADHYVPRTVTTGATDPNPPASGVPGYLARVRMWPRTGYPFSPTLTRVVGLVRFATSVDPTSPPVPAAAVTFTAVHLSGGSSTSDPAVVVQTADDGQYTFWFHPIVPPTGTPPPDPPLANQVAVTATATDASGVVRTGSLAQFAVTPNDVTYAQTILLS